jgi:hypothetical protein
MVFGHSADRFSTAQMAIFGFFLRPDMKKSVAARRGDVAIVPAL